MSVVVPVVLLAAGAPVPAPVLNKLNWSAAAIRPAGPNAFCRLSVGAGLTQLILAVATLFTCPCGELNCVGGVMVLVTVVPQVAEAETGHSTGTVILQPPAGKGPAAAVPLVNVMVLPPAVAEKVPLQVLVAAGEDATTNGEGSTSVKLTPVCADGEGIFFRLSTLIVRSVTPPGAVVVEAKLFLTRTGRAQAPPGSVAAFTKAGAILPAT